MNQNCSARSTREGHRKRPNAQGKMGKGCTETSQKINKNYSYVCEWKGNFSWNQDLQKKAPRLYRTKTEKEDSAQCGEGLEKTLIIAARSLNLLYRCHWTIAVHLTQPFFFQELILFSYLFVGCCFLCLFFCLVTGSLQHTNNSKRTVTTMA